MGELEANPLPLAQQVAVLEKKIAELRANEGKPSGELAAAETESGRAAAAAEIAAKALESAKSEQASKEKEVVRLKEEAAKTPPPADMAAKLAAARAERFQARQAVTNALEILHAKTKDAAGAKAKWEQAKSQNPADALAAATATLAKLKTAQLQAGAYRARETVAAKRREQEKLQAIAAEKQEEAKRAAAELKAAADSAARSKLQAAQKTALEEAQAAEAAVRRCAAELAAEQSRLDKLTADYHQVKSASLTVEQPSISR